MSSQAPAKLVSSESDIDNPWTTVQDGFTDNLPAYSGPSTPSAPVSHSTTATQSHSRPLNHIGGLPNIDFSKYAVSEATVSPDQTSLLTYLPSLSTDSAALLAFIQEQASLPPRPEIRITGTTRHTDGNGSSRVFDIRFNMLRYFVSAASGKGLNYVKLVEADEAAFRGGTVPTRMIAPGAGPSSLSSSSEPETLATWASRFAADGVTPRTFTLVRKVVNWDTEYLEGQIRNLVAAIRFPGQVSVTFPLANEKVVVHTPLKGIKFLSKLVSSVMGVKQYEVVTAMWPYATLAPNAQRGQSPSREFAVQSEDVWWNDWKETIRYAIVNKKHGWVSQDDYMEMAMGTSTAKT